MDIILASQSPRRRELLEKLGYRFEVLPACTEEFFDPNLDIDSALEQVAYEKAKAVQGQRPEALILSADTIVVHNGEILGKPRDDLEASEMLVNLSDDWHEVKTGVAVITPAFEITFADTARVHFRDLSSKEILDYVSTQKPLDKAGAYGIQEVSFADELEGNLSTVIGLPVEDVDMVMQLLHLLSHPVLPDYYY